MTLRSSIFRKLLLSGFLLITVTLLIMDFYLTRYTARQQVDQVEHVLTAQARILAEDIPADSSVLHQWTESAARRAQARITIIRRDGVVLADSQHDPETMENHLHRPEIQQAIHGRIGSSIRHSATLNRDLCYLAYPLAGGGREGSVLRIAVPLEQLDSAIAAVRRRVVGASLAAAALALIVAYYFSRRFTSRIRALQTFAEELPDGRFKALPPQGNDEIGALAGSLNRMAAQIGDLVDRLSLESARMQAILASMVEGVLAVDRERRVTFCNKSFARAMGTRIPVKEDMALPELVKEPELLQMIDRVLASGESVKARLQLPPGGGRAFEVQTAPLLTPSRRGAIAILHDISDLERLERVRKDFVANVSGK
ncbi:MAG: PAS domain-containing protein, partial [Acidobacteria bacterium]|nr:PAS domain-containing protein [Acidobacteriota bacterium]